MEVTELPSPEAPNLGQPSGDTGAGLQTEDNSVPTPGSPEYLGHMAKRGGASDEEVAMIVQAAQKSDPSYTKPNEENNDDTTGDSGSSANDTSDSNDGTDNNDDTSDENTEGLTLDSLQTEVTENNGKLTDASLDKLEAAGFNRAEIEKYVDAQYKLATAEATRVTAEVYSEVGGKERYLEMIEWAGDNMPMKDVKGINADLSSGDITKVKDAMTRLNQRYTAKNGNPPRKIQRGSKKSNTGPTDVFRSQAELTAAMNDPKYKKDPAYRNDVAKKLGRSPAFRMG